MAPEDLEKFVADTKELIEGLTNEVNALKTQNTGLVQFVNKHVEDVDRKINAIDNVAFAALGLHTIDGKTFELNTENIMLTRKAIEGTVEGFNDYRKQLEDQAKKAAEKEIKAAEKKAAVQAKRDAKKGKTTKKVADDGGTEKETN